uniref:DNA-directed DNA/RNA polymerase mu n=1 Tax=Cryptopsaras couesii TaxID=412659 RepID=A0AA49JBT1_CRYCE|nr:PolM [Cryptopsaras couesii]
MVPMKRRKLLPPGSGRTGPSRFPLVVLFLLERRMGASRRAFLSGLGRERGFRVEEEFSGNVTHVISENNDGDEVRVWLDSQVRGQDGTPAHLLDISWYTESLAAGLPVEILDRHQLREQQRSEAEVVMISVSSYACQRRTSLINHNAVLTDALSLLPHNAELNEDEGRGLAFRRAAAVLKFLPEPVTTTTPLRGLPCLGEHSLRVIEDILQDGASREVESTKRSERFKALKVLNGIFGVGVKTADRWIRAGIRYLQPLQGSGETLSRAQRAGLRYYDDLNQPVSRAEADAVGEIVEKAAVSVLPGARMTLIGGFRRGKLTGHDVDFLLTHPEEGREEGLMPKVVSRLESEGFLLYQKTTRNSYLESEDGPARSSSSMDRFQKCFSIFKLSRGEEGGAEQTGNGESLTPSGQEAWRAVRVDLVVSPVSQSAFALLGWTGSKLFEREMRRWARREKAMSLSSHALYDTRQRRYLRASSEEEIFALLGLEFIPPSERNA